jgi:hypothetical protein
MNISNQDLLKLIRKSDKDLSSDERALLNSNSENGRIKSLLETRSSGKDWTISGSSNI